MMRDEVVDFGGLLAVILFIGRLALLQEVLVFVVGGHSDDLFEGLGNW